MEKYIINDMGRKSTANVRYGTLAELQERWPNFPHDPIPGAHIKVKKCDDNFLDDHFLAVLNCEYNTKKYNESRNAPRFIFGIVYKCDENGNVIFASNAHINMWEGYYGYEKHENQIDNGHLIIDATL